MVHSRADRGMLPGSERVAEGVTGTPILEAGVVASAWRWRTARVALRSLRSALTYLEAVMHRSRLALLLGAPNRPGSP